MKEKTKRNHIDRLFKGVFVLSVASFGIIATLVFALVLRRSAVLIAGIFLFLVFAYVTGTVLDKL